MVCSIVFLDSYYSVVVRYDHSPHSRSWMHYPDPKGHSLGHTFSLSDILLTPGIPPSVYAFLTLLVQVFPDGYTPRHEH